VGSTSIPAGKRTVPERLAPSLFASAIH